MTPGPRAAVLAVAVFACAIAACSSGGSDSPTCSLDNPSKLAGSTWPRFRANPQNTGVAAEVVVAGTGELVWVYPPLGEPPRGPFLTPPALNQGETLVYVGSSDGTLYALNTTDGSRASFSFGVGAAITSGATLGYRNSQDAIFVGTGDASLYGLTATATNQDSDWPFLSAGFISATVNLSPYDGTLYLGTQAGTFVGVCPNGVIRFQVDAPAVQGSAAIDLDGNVYFGADDWVLRAIQKNGTLLWAFSTGAPIVAAPVVELANGETEAVYVADSAGGLFKVDSNGRPVPGFAFARVGPIRSSPALTADRLYVGSDDGRLYAVDSGTGAVVWTVATGGRVQSSPAVALGGANPVIVVGSDDGRLYFVSDEGTAGTVLATFDAGARIVSSPALGSDGTVYVGSSDGRVYAVR